MVVVRYRFERGSFSRQEKNFIHKVLRNKRGWRAYGYDIRNVSSGTPGARVDVRMHKWSDASIGAKLGMRGFSVCKYNGADEPCDIYINADLWNKKPAKFTGSQLQYRIYQICHEFGHALGWDHDKAGQNPSKPCSTMYQQTRGTTSCAPSPWPKGDAGRGYLQNRLSYAKKF